MPSRQKGFVHIAPLIFLVLGLGMALYLVSQKTNLLPKASSSNVSQIEILDQGGNVISSTSLVGTTKTQDIRLRVVYEPEPLPTPTPTPVNTDPTAVSGDWGLDWVPLQTGVYKIDFRDPETNQSWSDRVELRNGQTTEVKVLVDLQKIEINYFPEGNTLFGSGKLRVESVPAKAINIQAYRESEPVVTPPSISYDIRYPSKVRFANSEAELSTATEYDFQDTVLSTAWTLSSGYGLKTVYGQYRFEEGTDWKNLKSVQITLDAAQLPKEGTPTPTSGNIVVPKGPIHDLVSYYRDPEVSKTHYLHESLTRKDLERHPDWDPGAPRNSLWFEQQDQWTFFQYNYSPNDPNRYCSYDQLSVWDDGYFRYIASGKDSPKCTNGQRKERTDFEPPMIYMPRSWDEREGAWGIAGISEQVDKVDGDKVCSKTNHWVNEVLGWEELSPGDRAIHVRTSQRTTNSNCTYDSGEITWEENYWLGVLPVEGGGEAWGLKRSMGGQVEEYYRRAECQLSRDSYAVDEITRLQQERNCPTYWDIWFDTWKRLP